jgi:thiamine biosynthesis protein ThiI
MPRLFQRKADTANLDRFMSTHSTPAINSASSEASANRFLIGRFHEIVLKGRNRSRFVDQVKHNLRDLFRDYRLGRIHNEGPRLLAEIPDGLSDDIIRERAARIFGFQNFTISYPMPLDLEVMKRAAVAAAMKHQARSFRISTRRADKRFPLNSMEVDQIVGGEVAEKLGLKVDLTHPELDLAIEILAHVAYIADRKYPGAGGLPVGSTGRALLLLSGGIDSPVAGWRMMRRGLHVDFVHFHSHPLVSAASKEKAGELAAILTRFEARSTLALVPFAEVQRQIVARTLRPLRVVLYRRFMLRIASVLADETRASALITGESLGQVASQTLENMTVIETAATLPILRPLVGMDKNEIIVEARRLGTFETSILPDQDCCSLFVPDHPETRARHEQVAEAETQFDIDGMVAEAVAKTELVRNVFPCPPVK